MATLLVLVVPATVAASSTRPAALPHGIKSVQLNGGEKGALYSSIEPLAASSGGEIVVREERLGDGLLNTASNRYFTVATGRTALKALSLPAKLAPSAESVAASMATLEYYDKTAYKVLYRDLATGRSGTVKIPSTETWRGATPTGLLLTEPAVTKTKLVDYNVASKSSSTLGTFTSVSVLTSGADGVVVQTTTTTVSKLEYITYKPVKVSTLVPNTSGKTYQCGSVTTDAVGCLVYAGTSVSEARLPIPSGKAVETKVKELLAASPVVTPKATAWLDCGKGTTCKLEREKSSGGAPRAFTIPRVFGGNPGLQASGDNFLYGQLNNGSPAGGLFAFGDTASRPTHLVSAPASPLGAGAVSLSAKSVAWLDSSKPGIGIYQRSLKVSGGSVKLGSPKLLAQSGFVSTDSSSFGLSLSNAGSEVAYSSYRPQPARDPVGLDLDDNGRIRVISSDAAYSNYGEAYGPTVGPAVQIAGNFVLFETESPLQVVKFSLYDVQSAHLCTLSTGNVQYALGNGASQAELVFISKNGGVYEHTPSCSLAGASTIAPPAGPSATVYNVTGLGIADKFVTWGYDESGGTASVVASWVNLTGGGIRKILNPTAVVALVLSSTDIGVTTVSNGVTELHAISLPSGAETILATDSYDLSVGDGTAAWINQNSSTPFAGKI